MRTLLALPLMTLIGPTLAQQTSVITIQSEEVGRDVPVTTVVPSDYDKPSNIIRHYPVVFMLHGWDGDHTQWSETADLEAYADEYNMAIVCPDGLHDSWYVNAPNVPGQDYEDFFFEELLPKVRELFRWDKERTFITGLSMGGFGAMRFYLTRPEMFAGACATSGILDLEMFPNKWGMDDVFGRYEYNEDVYAAHSPVNLVENVAGMNKPILFDCGTSDIAYKAAVAFKEACDKAGVEATFLSGVGNHSHTYWRQSVAKHFEFFGELANSE